MLKIKFAKNIGRKYAENLRKILKYKKNFYGVLVNFPVNLKKNIEENFKKNLWQFLEKSEKS